MIDCGCFAKHLFTLCLLVIIIVAPSSVTLAAPSVEQPVETTIDELITSKKLSVELSIQKSEDIIAKQAVTIAIEILTDRWFAKGTQIESFDLEETVILPMSELAINGTKQVNGATWVSQIREITLYPMKPGIYQLPAIEVAVSINTESGIVSGVAYTKATEFEVLLPEALAGVDDYIVTSNLSLDVEGTFDQETPYNIGNAVTQVMTFSAENVPGMMLPVLSLPDLPGVSIYQKPSKIDDQSNRGTLTGSKIESFSYIFEQKGEFHLPEELFYWWNTTTNELETVTIPERSWSVSGELAKQSLPAKDHKLSPLSGTSLLFVLLVIVILYIAYRLYPYKTQLIQFYEKVTRKQYRQHAKCFIGAVKNQQFKLACQYLYLTVASNNKSKQQYDTLFLKKDYTNHPAFNEVFERLFRAAYGGEPSDFTVEDAQFLLQNLSRLTKLATTAPLQESIRLNPDK